MTKNIPKILFMNGSWMFLVIMPVIVPFLRRDGLSMEQVYTLTSIYSIGLVILEVPSGYLADLIGRKMSLVFAGLFHGISFTLLALDQSFFNLILFEVAGAIGMSLYSGTDVALIYDTLEAIDGQRKERTNTLGWRMFYGQIGETLAALLGGALAVTSLNLAAQVNAVVGWVPFFVALSLTEPPRSRLTTVSHKENFKMIWNALFGHSRLLTLVFLNTIAFGVATLVAVWAFQAYWGHIGVNVRYFGYLWAIYNLVVAMTARFAHRLKGVYGSARIFIFLALLPVVGFFGMGLVGSGLGVAFGLCFQMIRGINQVVLRDAINMRVDGRIRATANSFASMGVRLSFAFFGFLMGFLLDKEGFRYGFITFGIVFLVVFFFLSLPLYSEFRREAV